MKFMAKFDRSKIGTPRRDRRNKSSSDRHRRRSNDRDSDRGGRSRDRGGFRSGGFRDRDSGRDRRSSRELVKTKVTCDSCSKECEVPFKPTSSKPVYCDACYKKNDKGSSGKRSSGDLDLVLEKLDKIMKALEIK